MVASPHEDPVLHIAVLHFEHYNILDSMGSKVFEADVVDAGVALRVRLAMLHMLVNDYLGDIQEDA